MRRIIFIFIFIVPFFVNAQSYDAYKRETFHSKDGFALPYRILYPENYDPSVSYPLVIFLHGVLERGRDNGSQLINGGALFLNKENRKNFPAIVIFPQCPHENYWAAVTITQKHLPIDIRFHYDEPPTAAMKALLGLIEKFVEEEKADSRRIYLMGLSMGGMGTFEAISRYPDVFAAAVPMCGAGDTSYCEGYAGKTALWIFHGGADKGIDPEESRRIVRKLKSLGAPPQYTEYKGVGHNCWDKALAEPDLLSWMFRQKKAKKRPFNMTFN